MELHDKYVTTVALTWEIMRSAESEISLLKDIADRIESPKRDLDKHEKRILKGVVASLQKTREINFLLRILEENLYSMYYDGRRNDGELYMDALLKEAAIMRGEATDGT